MKWRNLKAKLKFKPEGDIELEEEKKPVSDELSLSGMREKKVSPLNIPVWRSVLLVSAGCAAAWLFLFLFGFDKPFIIWFTALIICASWFIAIRMLLLDTRLKKFWIAWHVLGFSLMLLLPGSRGIWIASNSFSFVFLIFRRYKPYRHLTSRRRVGFFLLGVVIFSLITIGFLPSKLEEPLQFQIGDYVQTKESIPSTEKYSSLVNLGHNLTQYGLSSLRMFWFFSLFHLFFAIRLHFMRLKPKLAVSAFMIAVIPLLLVITIGLITLYSFLGESRAARARSIMENWANMAVLDENFIHSISDRSFSYETDAQRVKKTGETPVWLPEFLSSLKKDDSPYTEWASSGRAQYLWIGTELWLVKLANVENPNIRINGCHIDNTMMHGLADILHSDVILSFAGTIIQGDDSITVREDESQPNFEQIQGTFLQEEKDKQEPGDAETSLWKRSLYFGVTHLDVTHIESGQFLEQTLLITIKITISNILQELFSEKNPLSMVVMIALLSLAVIMLIMEAFALFFGVRITAGITSAVKALHRGTRRIAEGDLDSEIDIPNEDELGDLATSFNLMATAVKKGREEAIERERLESELETARKIQERLLPHEMPSVPGFEIAGTSLPSQQVGGDYFDFLDMGSEQLGIAIADVSGKGIPAALLMANLQASLHAQVIKTGEVAEVASRMNNLLVKSTDSHMFATFFYGILDRKESNFISTNAGHNPPILFRKDGKIERLEAGGLMLGFLLDQEYVQQTVTIMPGDVLILYTDGVTEAISPSEEESTGKFFGENRLIDVVGSNASNSVIEIQSAILNAIRDHTEGAPQHDDITLVIIKRREQE